MNAENMVNLYNTELFPMHCILNFFELIVVKFDVDKLDSRKDIL